MLALRMKKAVRNGATLVVADPRKIWLTKIAKRHLQLRPGIGRLADQRDDARDPRGGARRTRSTSASSRTTSTRCARSSRATRPRRPSRSRASRPRTSARRRASTRHERHAAIFYTLGITEHACGVDNIWSLSNLVLMTGHLGYESTGLNALRGQNNVQGLNDSGANPSYLPGYQPVDDPEVREKFSEAWGVEVPETPGYRLDQIMSGLHDGRDPGALPHRREPDADGAERPPRRGGPRRARLHRLAGHLPERHDDASTPTSCCPRRASRRRTGRSRTPSGG